MLSVTNILRGSRRGEGILERDDDVPLARVRRRRLKEDVQEVLTVGDVRPARRFEPETHSGYQ